MRVALLILPTLMGCNGGAPQGEVSLTKADVVLVGEPASEDFVWSGTAVSRAGDVDGDGIGDVIIGVEAAGIGGRAYVVKGPIERNMELADGADVILESEVELANAGLAVASAGDVNEDGFDDVLVGAPALMEDINDETGAAYLLFGPLEDGTRSLDNTAGVKFTTSSPYDWVGHSLASAGDVNGDGHVDVLIGGTPFFGQQPVNAAQIFFGPLEAGTQSTVGADLSIYSDQDGYIMRQARYQAAAGDLDGDGFGDIAVGGFADGLDEVGQVYVFHGAADIGGIVRYSDADLTLEGDVIQGNAGLSVAAVQSDIDGDGTWDLLVGAPGFTDAIAGDFEVAGGAYLIDGSATGVLGLDQAALRFIGEFAGDLAGFDVASAGDVDADGFGDVLVSAPSHFRDQVAGAAYLFYGPLGTGSLGLEQADASFFSADPVGGSGSWVGSAGDVNGDGFDDILIGGFLDRGQGAEATAFVFHGGQRR